MLKGAKQNVKWFIRVHYTSAQKQRSKKKNNNQPQTVSTRILDKRLQ